MRDPQPFYGRFTAEPHPPHFECAYCETSSPRRDYVTCDCGTVICDKCQSELESLLGCCRSEECKVREVEALRERCKAKAVEVAARQ